MHRKKGYHFQTQENVSKRGFFQFSELITFMHVHPYRYIAKIGDTVIENASINTEKE